VATFGDVYRPYVKPSLDGKLVLRKRTSNQTSARLKDRKEKIPDTEPARLAYRACVDDGKAVEKRVYVPGKGYEIKKVCPIKEFKKYLKDAMPV